MLVILRHISAGEFLFILLPAKHLTLHTDHESPWQTPAVLGSGTARRLPVILPALLLTGTGTPPFIYP